MALTHDIDTTAERSIVISRTVKAPRELVFAAFTDREHIDQWWGPDEFATTTIEMDVRAGGVWRFTMHGPDGVDYPNRIAYSEVTRPERLVYVHDDDGATDDLRFEGMITFEEQGKETLVTLRTVFATAAMRNEVVTKHGAIEGGKQTLARLAAYVERELNSRRRAAP